MRASKFLLAALLLTGAAAAEGVKPWEPDESCGWWLSNEDGKSHLASIGPGDGNLVLSISDPAFLAWPEEDSPHVELRFDGDAARRVATDGWSTHIEEDGIAKFGMFGMFLDADGRAKFAGATRIELLRDGRTIVDLPLAATPDLAALEACVPPPESESLDVE